MSLENKNEKLILLSRGNIFSQSKRNEKVTHWIEKSKKSKEILSYLNFPTHAKIKGYLNMISLSILIHVIVQRNTVHILSILSISLESQNLTKNVRQDLSRTFMVRLYVMLCAIWYY